MEAKGMILSLHKNLGLLQDEFAEKLFTIGQTVPRWENGETIPGIDTLELIAETFRVSVNHLLGRPAEFCQSCGMMSGKDNDKGTKLDGSESKEYCTFCFQHREFTENISMEELVEHNLQHLDEQNESAELHPTEQEARMQLMKFLPALEWWKTNSK